MKKGTVVLTLFPFTDLTSSKRRPAVVISDSVSDQNDVIVAFVSSVIPPAFSETDFFYDTLQPDFSQSGLKKSSIIKLDKLATINKSIISGELGAMNNRSIETINRKLKIALGLD